MSAPASVPPRRAAVVSLLVGALIAALSGAGLVLGGRERLGGASAAAALVLLVVAGRAARRRAWSRFLFADSAVERLGDAALLAAVAWARLPEEPRVGAAALVALVASYLASYLRARSVGLGFDLEESTVDRAVLLGALSLGLVTGLVEAGLWASAGWSVVVIGRRTAEVASQGEPG
ncbi:MAG TPA: hypothetical protein VGB28_00780 [Actinomycetota bacterium]|jgi:hypothetical protein